MKDDVDVSNPITTATSADIADLQPTVAVLPIGSFEQHGPYLPLATDTLIACVIARELATAYPVLELPPLTISCSHEHAAWPGTVSISARTLHQVITDIGESLERSDINHMALINGHGGNYVLANIVQEASVRGARMTLFPTNRDWDRARAAAGMTTSAHEDMHAGEFETSVLLHTWPAVVRAGNETADWTADERPHLLSLGMAPYTSSGIIGRPSLGTAEKGKLALTSLVESFGEHLRILN